jgi:excinuclease ABC subunit C
VRQCEDTFFRTRTRPCLQYQIKRCTAPCVGFIERERYLQDVRHAVLFLEGKSRVVIDEMMQRMEEAARREDFEAAALYRDRIGVLKRIQERQYITGKSGDADVFAVATVGEVACIQATFIRGGMNLGAKSFFPKTGRGATPEEALAAFLPQYYLNAAGGAGKPIPERIYTSHAVADRHVLQDVFGRLAGRKVALIGGARGAPRRWLDMAKRNATEEARRAANNQLNLDARFEALRTALNLDETPQRLECFDISHTMGEAPVAACVVFDRNGPLKSDYRRFNIEGVEPGDDYGAIAQALLRRYRKVKEGAGRLPDVLFIDGGKGQVSTARNVLEELQIKGLKLVGVAKGKERKPGAEQLFLSGENVPTILPSDSPALHLVQQIRDEAHRFAITGHRNRRGRARTTSLLERIAGIGDKRRQSLLKNLGGMREVERAGVDDLARIPGISPALARRIYDALHEQE